MNKFSLSPQSGNFVTTVIALLATGIPYWLLPYNQLSLPSSLSTIGLMTVLAAAMLSRGYFHASFVRAWVINRCAVPAAIMMQGFWRAVCCPPYFKNFVKSTNSA